MINVLPDGASDRYGMASGESHARAGMPAIVSIATAVFRPGRLSPFTIMSTYDRLHRRRSAAAREPPTDLTQREKRVRVESGVVTSAVLSMPSKLHLSCTKRQLSCATAWQWERQRG